MNQLSLWARKILTMFKYTLCVSHHLLSSNTAESLLVDGICCTTLQFHIHSSDCVHVDLTIVNHVCLV